MPTVPGGVRTTGRAWCAFPIAGLRRKPTDAAGADEGGIHSSAIPPPERRRRRRSSRYGRPLGLDDEVDPAVDARAMAQARSLGVVVGAHAMNEGADHDPLPSF